MALKNKFLIVLILLISISIISLKIYTIRKHIGEEAQRIFEIVNTEEMYRDLVSNIVTIRKHYMIINPPEDLHELKLLIEKFHNDLTIENKIMVGQTRHFEVYFYRSSKKLTPKWKPKEGYLETDRIEHHKDDLIASIYWSDSKPEKYYYTMNKSKDKNNYGTVIERIEYVDNTIIRRIK